MEKTENGEIDLNNIIRTVWKRRKLIIVVTFVCMVVGGIIMNFRSSVTYRSDAVIKMGKKVEYKKISATFSVAPTVTCSEESADPENVICIKYDPGNKEDSRYSIDAEIIDASPMIRVIINGPDRGTEKVLSEIVNGLIHDYNKIEETSVTQYKDAIRYANTKLEAGAKVIQDKMAVTDGKIKKMRGLERRVYKEALDKMFVEWEEGADSEDIFLIGPLLQGVGSLGNRIIDEEGHLKSMKASLEKIQSQIIVHQALLKSFNGSNTNMIGGVKNSVVEPKRMRGVLMCGIVGFALAIFLIFIIESVKERVERKKNLA